MNLLLKLLAIFAIVATAVSALAFTGLHTLISRTCLVLQISFISVIYRIPGILLVFVALLLLVVELLGEDVLHQGLLARANDLLTVNAGSLGRATIQINRGACWLV